MEIKYKSLIGIKSSMVDECWDKLSPYIDRALKRTKSDMFWNVNHVKQYIEDREAQLWAVVDEEKLIGAIVTQIITYPKCKVLDMWLVGGDSLKTFNDSYETLKEYARSNNCEAVRGFGRKGWTRLVKDDKFYEAYWITKL